MQVNYHAYMSHNQKMYQNWLCKLAVITSGFLFIHLILILNLFEILLLFGTVFTHSDIHASHTYTFLPGFVRKMSLENTNTSNIENSSRYLIRKNSGPESLHVITQLKLLTLLKKVCIVL